MAEVSNSVTSMSSHQREPGAVRTALPSRPMSKPRDESNTHSRMSPDDSSHHLKVKQGSRSPCSRGSPDDDGTSSKSGKGGSKKKQSAGSSSGQGQVCR